MDEGTPIVLWQCHQSYHSMQWTMPADGAGPIRLRHNRSKCIDEHNHNLESNGADARLRFCHEAETRSDRAWKEVVHGVIGQVHWAPHGGQTCLRVRRPIPGTPVVTGDCNIRSIQAQFIFPGRSGLIRWAAYPHLCLDLPKADTHNGHLLRVWHCHDNFKSMIWEVPDGRGPIRLQHNTKHCIRAAETHGMVRIHNCDGVPPTEQWNVVPRTDRKWGSPSLLCVSVMLPHGYEQALLRTQLERAPIEGRDLGIFDCDEFTVFSRQRVRIGWHHQAGWIHSVPFQQAHVGVSASGTAGNSKLFMNLWNAVKSHGRFEHHAWTLKVDPDAVVVPERLRGFLRPHAHGAKFLKNCNAFPQSPNFPMIYGALEAYSKDALLHYYGQQHRCKSSLNWHAMGEDKYMGDCMDMLGIPAFVDTSIVGDRRCAPATTCSQHHGAFHPFKTVDSWFGCWHAAVHG